jgi:Zn-dependent M28 family amino/carboxypeptidase
VRGLFSFLEVGRVGLLTFTARLSFGVLALTCAGLASAQSVEIPAAVESAANQYITKDTLIAPLRFLSSDLLEGRGPATRGDELARAYLASELQSLGYQPAGPNGEWQQPFDVVGIRTKAPSAWPFDVKGQKVDLKWSEEYIVASGVQKEQTQIQDAELVFVGYGIEAPEYKWNDFKGANLKGKVLVMLNNDPDWDPKLFEGKRRLYYGRWSYKYESGARQGAAGVLIIHTTPSAGYPWQVVQTSWSGEQFELPAEGEPRIQFRGWMTEAATRKLFKAAGQDLDKLVAAAHKPTFKPVPLGIKTSLSTVNTVSRVKTANVAGILPGSDPTLKDQVIIYSAHHDHLGMAALDPNKPDADRIYNGAMDNASGCAQLLAIARAYAGLAERPKRSIMMLFVAGEEQGLLGSKYYSLHPTVKPGKIAANLNFDGGNIWGKTQDVTLIGNGKSSLDAVAQAIAAKQGRTIKPDQFPDRGFYYRSDQFSFAKIGVPALYFDTGTEFVGRPAGWGREQQEEHEAKDYHQPSDELSDTWNFDGMIQDAQLGLYSGWVISQTQALPTWNKGDEFEAARTKALADVN